MNELLTVDVEGWKSELDSIKDYYDSFGDRLPQGLKDELAELEKRLDEAG